MNTELSRTSPIADMIDWFENGAPRALRTLGLTPYVRVEDYVEDGTYVVRAEMPGIDPDEDVTLSVSGDVLTIAGERREEKKEKNRQELHYGSFRRSVQLPRGVQPDQISATYTDGVLEVRVPGVDRESTTVTVPVKTAPREETS